MCACVWVNIETVCHGNIRSNSPESLARWCVCVQVCVCVGGGGFTCWLVKEMCVTYSPEPTHDGLNRTGTSMLPPASTST